MECMNIDMFSVKKTVVNFSALQPYSLLQLIIVVGKQPQTIHKWKGIAVFQQNFIYKNKLQAGFGPRAMVCWPLF